jgi:hypothetical protein
MLDTLTDRIAEVLDRAIGDRVNDLEFAGLVDDVRDAALDGFAEHLLSA